MFSNSGADTDVECLVRNGIDFLKGSGCAHGKVILVGEHAVLYGHPAIAAPLTQLHTRVTVERESAPKPSMVLGQQRATETVREPQTSLLDPKEICAALGLGESDLCVTIDNSVPTGRGLGSSAAAGLALVRAIADFHGRSLARDEELQMVSLLEVEAHGRASGVDAYAASSSELMLFRDGRSQPQSVAPGCGAALVVVDSGLVSRTGQAVAGVAALLAAHRAPTTRTIDQIGDVVRRSITLLTMGEIDGLGAAFNEITSSCES
ncbi:mevalonate kinase family protein [Nocardia salmonicida]|uniref:mevalonate kinase family protein n=1 Tax=Nocardia salmonicida TaxID=53431 RepID=UPI00362D6647